MSDDPIIQYMDAHARLNAADNALRSIAEPLETISKAARGNPYSAVLQNADGGPPDSKRATAYSAKTVDMAKWPDASAVASLLAEWKQARLDVENLWQSVPKERRASLVGPERAPGGDQDPMRRNY